MIEFAELSATTKKFAVSMLLAALWLCMSGSQLAAQTFTTPINFDGPDGANSAAGLVQATNGNFYGTAALIQATDGNFYGTTSGFGVSNTGTIFKITPGGTLTTLFTFDGTDGELPYSTLLEGSNGDLYGTTEFGASTACSEGCGTVFSLSAGLN